MLPFQVSSQTIFLCISLFHTPTNGTVDMCHTTPDASIKYYWGTQLYPMKRFRPYSLCSRLPVNVLTIPCPHDWVDAQNKEGLDALVEIFTLTINAFSDSPIIRAKSKPI